MEIYHSNEKLKEKLDIEREKSTSFSTFLTHHLIPFYSIFKKTITINLYSWRKFVLSIFMLNILSIFAMFVTKPSFLMPTSPINDTLGVMQVVFTYLIISVGILNVNCAPTISEEITRGTMILLVSKPISRSKIVFGKFLAIYFYNFILNLVSLLIICISNYIIFPYQDIFLFFTSQFLILLVILTFFSTLIMGISMILKDSKIAVLIPLMFILIMFFIIFFIKPILLSGYIFGQTYYEAFQLYHFDIGYHIMNVYVGILEGLHYPLRDDFFNSFAIWSTHKIIPDEMPFGMDEVVRTHYYTPFASLILLISIGLVIFIVGLYIFKRREINS